MDLLKQSERVELLQTQQAKALRDRDTVQTEMDLLREKLDKNSALIQKLQVCTLGTLHNCTLLQVE